ncbi:MAG: hypothetical protein AB1394_13515, partial [Bacteroidota bacterium]
MNNKVFKSSVQYATIVFLIAVSLLLIPEQVQSQNTVLSELRVMSFNIRFGTANDGENSWQFRRYNLMETIKKFDPEILGIQEALSFQIDEILNRFPYFAILGVGRDDGRQAGEYSCILY